MSIFHTLRPMTADHFLFGCQMYTKVTMPILTNFQPQLRTTKLSRP